jgi:hypothetical protein
MQAGNRTATLAPTAHRAKIGSGEVAMNKRDSTARDRKETARKAPKTRPDPALVKDILADASKSPERDAKDTIVPEGGE